MILTIVGCELPSEESQRIPARSLLLVGAACVLATLANPYGYNIYRQVVEYSLLTEAFQSVLGTTVALLSFPGGLDGGHADGSRIVCSGIKATITAFPDAFAALGLFFGVQSPQGCLGHSLWRQRLSSATT